MNQKRPRRWLFLPDDALEDIAIIANLTTLQISHLRELLDSSEFELRYKFYVQTAEILGISDEAAAKICTFINYIQKQRVANKRSSADVLAEFDLFLGRDDESAEAQRIRELLRQRKEALSGLLSDRSKFEAGEKVRGLQTGPIPHLYSFRAFCDVRPVFDKDAENIVECFPVITLNLVTHSSMTDEKREILVQLTESDLGEFREQFDRLDKKLDELRSRFPSSLQGSNGLGERQ